MAENSEEYSNYFLKRNIDPGSYRKFIIPPYLKNVMPSDKSAAILDIGCGLGQLLSAMKEEGYSNLHGIDVSIDAVTYCRQIGLNVESIGNLQSFCDQTLEGYDFVVMSHVLEHLPKDEIIETLKVIKSKLIKPTAALVVVTPNAQANTGAYWAYEDFTHSVIFTAGSLYYVLRSAGFTNIYFLDQKGVEGANVLVKILRLFFLSIYRFNLFFWNRVTRSSFHRPSPQIFTYELKVLAK